MPTRVCGPEQLADPLRPNLEALARNVDRDPVRSKRLIRQFLEEDRDGFLRGALQILKTQMDSCGAQYLLGVLIANGLLLPALCDPGLARDVALPLAKAAIRIDPTVDIALARTLADNVAAGDTGPNDQHARLMEILAAISDGSRIFPSLVRLLRHANPHVRSKAVLMIGRGNRSPKWVRQRLGDADPRIRANAAEALWGVGTDEARELLHSLVHDSNNRVAGNAIVGLYRLGDSAAIPELAAISRHPSALFRATAAWAMGETGDPRFTELLAVLLRGPNAVVRKRAFAALGGIRAAVALSTQAPPCRLAARLLDPDPSRPGRRVCVGAVAEDGPVFPDLLATQILLAEDGQNIWSYRVVERPMPETLSVVFLLPRSAGGNAVLPCLRWKRPGDLWASVFYGREPQPIVHEPFPKLQSNPESIADELERVPPATDCPGLGRAVAAAVSTEKGALPGKRCLIVLAEGATRAILPEELVGAVAAAQAFVQVLSPAPNAALEEFCHRVNGVFWYGGADSAVAAYLNLFTRYEVSWQPAKPDARALKIRLHGPGLSGETQLALTA